MNVERRKQALLHRSNALAAMNNPALRASIRDLCRQSAIHGEVALGLSDAMKWKAAQQEAQAPLQRPIVSCCPGWAAPKSQ